METNLQWYVIILTKNPHTHLLKHFLYLINNCTKQVKLAPNKALISQKFSH